MRTKRFFSFFNHLKQVTFVTKSADRGEGRNLPAGHKRLLDIEHERQEHKKNGDIFAQEFKRAHGGSGFKVEHLAVQDFLKWSSKEVDREGHLVCTIGGDGTFIQTAQNIRSRGTLTLGINPEPQNSIGFLCGFQFNDKKDISKAAQKLIKSLEKETCKIVLRPRVRVLNLTRPEIQYPLGILH